LLTIMAAEMAVLGVTGITVVPGGMQEAVIRAAVAGMVVVLLGITLPLAGMVVVAGIMVVTAAAGELAPRLVSVLALDYSEER
jgi:hypothetical protein